MRNKGSWGLLGEKVEHDTPAGGATHVQLLDHAGRTLAAAPQKNTLRKAETLFWGKKEPAS